MEYILKASNLNKYFHQPDDFHVLKNLNIEVKRKEFIAITGKSGCGKSTLLYLLSTLDTGYEGELIINDTKVTGLSQNSLAKFRNENIGFVFQFHYLLPEFTVLQNIMLPALKLGKYSHSEIKANCMEKLKLVEMEAYADKLSSKLSGGQQQRVAIARALINNPKIIMADEPTGNLDSGNSKVVFDIFQNLVHNEGNTIIAVTHDRDFAKGCDRTIEMKDGEIVGQ